MMKNVYLKLIGKIISKIQAAFPLKSDIRPLYLISYLVFIMFQEVEYKLL